MKLLKNLCIASAVILTAQSYASTEPKVIAYYQNYAVYSANFHPNDIPYKDLDQINYSFLQVGSCAGPNTEYPTEKAIDEVIKNPSHSAGGGCLKKDNTFFGLDNKLHTTDPWSDFGSNDEVKALEPKICDSFGADASTCGWAYGTAKGTLGKVLSHNKPTVLIIGGWSLSAAIRYAIEPSQVDGFVASIKPWLEFDQWKDAPGKKVAGIEIDWEPNGNMWTKAPASNTNVSVSCQDMHNFLHALKLIRSSYPNISLSIAGPAGKDVILAAQKTWETCGSGKYWQEIASTVDHIGVMSYDYHGTWDSYTDFNAPLKSDPSNPNTLDSGETTMQEYINQGVPSHKLVMGVAAYGRTYHLQEKPTDLTHLPGLFEEYSTTNLDFCGIGDPIIRYRNYASGKCENGQNTPIKFISNTIDTKYANQNAVLIDNGGNGLFATFDTPQSLIAKTNYIKQSNLGGIMVWAVDQDLRGSNGFAVDNSLVQAMKAVKYK